MLLIPLLCRPFSSFLEEFKRRSQLHISYLDDLGLEDELKENIEHCKCVSKILSEYRLVISFACKNGNIDVIGQEACGCEITGEEDIKS